MLQLYTKPDCPLCDEIRDLLEGEGARWKEINIMEDLDLWTPYHNEIPVVRSNQGIWFYRDRKIIPLIQWLSQTS